MPQEDTERHPQGTERHPRPSRRDSARVRGRLAAGALLLCLILTGCGDTLLERSYSSLSPHSAVYWENEDADTLRAENYQDLVNALLLLLGEHSEDGIVRLYGERPDSAALASRACVEVQQETALGAYLLDYITYDGSTEGGYYELSVRFRYRRTAEEQSAIVNATSTEALPDLLRSALEEGRESLAVRIGYFGTDRAGVLDLIAGVHDEIWPPEGDAPEGDAPEGNAPEGNVPEAADAGAPKDVSSEDVSARPEAAAPGAAGIEAGTEPGLAPWQVRFYPDTDQPGLVEILLRESGTDAATG